MMDRTTFNNFKDIVYENSGIALNEGKEALVCARVGKRMRALNIVDYRGYLQYLKHDDSREEIIQLLDVISTNVTSFFREPSHFEFVREIMAQWLARGQNRFRFWSAACSTGEEPYSLAITLLEDLAGREMDVKILATDLSTRVLEISRKGIYEQDKLKHVSPTLREQYFERLQDGRAISYAVKDRLKRLITFRRLNLATPPFPLHGPLDVIFCRNVMIYFDNKVRSRLLAEADRLLRPGGFLIVGHAESLTGMMSNLKTVKPAVYRKS